MLSLWGRCYISLSLLLIRLSECTPCSHIGVAWYLPMRLPSHCICASLFQRMVCFGVAGKCEFSEGGLGNGEGGVFMAGWALAGHRRFCSGI